MANNVDPGAYYDAYQSSNAAVNTQQSAPSFDAGAHYDAYTQNQNDITKNPGFAAAVTGNPAATGNPIQDNSAYNTAQSGVPSAATAAKLDPSFTQKVDMINTGAGRAIAQFQTGLMSIGAKIGKTMGMPADQYRQVQNQIKAYNASFDADQQKNIDTYNGSYPQIGSFVGNVSATAPFAGVYGKVAELGALNAETLGGGALGTAAKYATNATGGALTSAGIEGLKYDPNNANGGLFNTGAAKQVLTDPLSYAIPAALTRGPGWVQDANALAEAQKVIPNITNANVSPTVSPIMRAVNKGLSVVSNITGTGNGVSQIRDIGGPVSNFVQQVSGLPTKMGSEDLINYAGKQVQSTVKSLHDQGNELWDAVPQDAPLVDPEAATSVAKQALDRINAGKLDGSGVTKSYMNQILDKNNSVSLDKNGDLQLSSGPLTVGDAKQIRTLIGNAASNAFTVKGGVGIPLGQDLLGMKDQLLQHMNASMDADGQEALSAARQHSALLSQFEKNSPLAAQAITDEVSARDLVRNIIGSPQQYDHSNSILDVMNPAGNPGGLSAPNALAQKSMAAAKLAQVMQQSNKPGGMDINQFLTNTQNDQTLAPLMGNDSYKSLQGLSQYMKNIQDNSIGAGKSWTIGGAAASLGAAGALMGHPAASAAATASYLLASYVANSSPLKNLFNTYINPNISSSLKSYLESRIGGQLNNAGFQLDQSGVFRHKGEVPLSQQQPSQ